MINIRRAELKDIPCPVNNWLELIGYHIKLDHYYYEMGKQAVTNYKKWVRKNILGKNSIFLVAEDNKKIIGHAGGSIEKRPPWL